MKIYATQNYSGTYGTYTQGQTYTVTDANAKNLERLGVANIIDGQAYVMPFAPTSSAVFVPNSLDYLGIQVAISACVAVGGGIVQFQEAVYSIGDNTITPVAGVHFAGVGMGTRMDNPALMTGTIIRSTSTTKPVFGFNTVDRGSPYTLATGSGGTPGFFDSMISNVTIRDLMTDGGTYGVKIGALYEPGIADLVMRNVAAMNATVTGFHLENCHCLDTHNLRAYNFLQNGFVYYSSGGAPSGSWWNFGQNNIGHLICQSPTRNAHKIIIAARGQNGNLNDTHLNVAAAIQGEALFTEAVTVTAGSADIPVSDLTKYGIGVGVKFTGAFGTVSGLNSSTGKVGNTTYFVTYVSGTSGAGVIRVSGKFGGANITPGGTGTANVTIGGRGGCGIFIGTIDTWGTAATVSSCSARGLDIESVGTCGLVLQGVVYSSIDTQIIPTNTTTYGSNFVLRSISNDLFLRASERPYQIDWDGSGFPKYFGVVPNTYDTNNQGQPILPGGIAYDPAKFSERLQFGEGAIYGEASGNAGGLRPLVGVDACFKLWTQETNEATQGGYHSSCISYYGAPGSTYTLRGTANANDESKGFFLYFFNTNAFGTTAVVLNGGGLNIRGKGASGTTISVPGDTGVILQLMKRNGVWFWAQFA